jgi:hypothetical protein
LIKSAQKQQTVTMEVTETESGYNFNAATSFENKDKKRWTGVVNLTKNPPRKWKSAPRTGEFLIPVVDDQGVEYDHESMWLRS